MTRMKFLAGQFEPKYFWPACAVTLGVWESAALLSKGKVPLITSLTRNCHRKWRRRTEAVVGIWLVGLGAHLLQEATNVEANLSGSNESGSLRS